jgi:hypothetical protein
MKYLLLLLVLICLVSCSKDDKPPLQQNTQKNQPDENDNPEDTNLTPEEKFSVSILSDFLGDSDDEDLASFLETQIYKMDSAYTGAAVVEITPSTWLVMLEKDGNTKNYLLQKSMLILKPIILLHIQRNSPHAKRYNHKGKAKHLGE